MSRSFVNRRFAVCRIVFGLLLCATMILPASGCRRINLGEGVNMFDKDDKNKKRLPKRGVAEPDTVRQMTQAMERAFDPETKQEGRPLTLYILFFIFMLCLIGGLAYWQFSRRRQLEREIKDPLFLVQELNTAHQISPQEKQLMQDLAADNSLPTPLKIFIEPQFLLDAMKDETYSLLRPVVKSLLLRLFSIEAEPPSMPEKGVSQ